MIDTLTQIKIGVLLGYFICAIVVIVIYMFLYNYEVKLLNKFLNEKKLTDSYINWKNNRKLEV